MDAPTRRRLIAAGGLVLAAPQSVLAAAKPRVAIKTPRGVIVVELEPRRAPLTVANFLRYVDARSYDGGSFFRAARTPGVAKDGTIVGAPDAKVRPFPPIAHESTTKTGLKHLNGTISLGRFATGTATSNFFICVGDQPYLDANPAAKGDNLGYAAFGRVVQGMPVVEKILSLPTNGETKFKDQRGQWLKPPVPITTMRRT
ncbi:peptidylprolyl isomerase [Phenylobacterium sp. 58.2.17]|uniref:peptidylprolyl isomerase n=1 Tax=Phenylobacterium sp. 58.2.17 TaxID=2969306 RepID=UPI0022647108|nr:peptidylprolyl isomerase [Phenylobacterium sp. 58.2.17]MCX7587333.1 peptidylprolyl isomerase [Phenylobacterium sp. 58.2.17]